MSVVQFDKAIALFGSQAKLAAKLGVSKNRVSQWRHRHCVPLERCLEIERETRKIAREHDDQRLIVTCEDLRPDVDWSVVRDNPRPVARSAFVPQGC